MNWNKLKYLLPSRRRAEEREMRDELESLAHIAGHGELGNLTLAADSAREAWGWPWDGVLADIRFSFRTMRKNPGFTAVAVVTLALGIGANSAMFSFADAILLRPLPVMRPSEIVRVSSATPNDAQEGMSYPDYRDLRRESHSFSGSAGYDQQPSGSVLHQYRRESGRHCWSATISLMPWVWRHFSAEPFLLENAMPATGPRL